MRYLFQRRTEKCSRLRRIRLLFPPKMELGLHLRRNVVGLLPGLHRPLTMLLFTTPKHNKKKQLHFCNCLIFKWCHQESNRGHKDFQSFSCYANQKQASDCNQLSYGTLQAVLLFYFCLISPWFNSWFTCGFTQVYVPKISYKIYNIQFYHKNRRVNVLINLDASLNNPSFYSIEFFRF